MRNTMKTAARLLLGIALAGAAACGGAADGPSGPAGGTEPPETPQTPSVTGTWTLKLVNGHELPALLWYDDTAADMDAEMYILSGSIVLRSDGTFRSTSVSQLVIQGDGVHDGVDMSETSINDGTYTVEPDRGSNGGNWLIQLRGENGAQGGVSYDPVGGTLLSSAMIPGAPGQPDISVIKEYSR
jgi:hypothetical protein